MKKVAVIGHFAFGYQFLDGQTVKTKNVAEGLRRSFGKENVLCIDTHGGVKTLVLSLFYVLKALAEANNVLILPAHNGLRVFGRLLPFFKLFFRNRRIFYSVIGGWLPKALTTEPRLAKCLKTFDGIYVETSTMKKALDSQGFENVSVVPNFKELTALSKDELIYRKEAPFGLCTFSRVMKEKGIEAAVDAISRVNSELGYLAYTLDIYGQVDSAQTEWFENLKQRFGTDVKYCGCVEAEKSVEVLKNYFALLFPTHFYTEGIPGTIIDAYASGIPVISAKWESFSDVVDDGVTGIGYEFDNAEDLKETLIAIAKEPEKLNTLKENCLKKSTAFTPSVAMESILKNLL